MKKRTLFAKTKKRMDPGMSLQITSMADVFTILLVFLLKGIATDAIQITPASATQLASTTTAHPLQERALQVEITPTEILVEKESAGKLDHFQKELGNRLQLARQRQDLIAKTNNTVQKDGKAIVIADRKTNYALIKSVLKTLSDNGFNEIQFAVLQE